MNGEQCVTVVGISVTHMWSAGSWDLEVCIIIIVNRMGYY